MESVQARHGEPPSPCTSQQSPLNEPSGMRWKRV